MAEQIVQVAVDRDGTGRATVTIRLVQWSMKDLLRLAGSLLVDRETERVGRALSKRLQEGKGARP